ncbi:MAG: biotin--[acetyl-CoA-carboxylase] ligase [Treponema sp.]|nr:biotin--[acetyl-CoA-carboxylase] ligase [Treponema sp.]
MNPWGAPLYHEERVSSTMDYARALAGRNAPSGTVAAADFQESGRGRSGRPWFSPAGNLYFTVLLRYGGIASIPAALTLRAGLAAALALETCFPVLAGAVKIKWPNDIMLAGPGGAARKTAGILSEAAGGTVLVGVGVNLGRKEFPPELSARATSVALALEAYGARYDGAARGVLLEKILFALQQTLAGDDWRRGVEARLYKKGETVRFIAGAAVNDGAAAAVEGDLAGVREDGALLLASGGETRACLTGELDVYS